MSAILSRRFALTGAAVVALPMVPAAEPCAHPDAAIIAYCREASTLNAAFERELADLDDLDDRRIFIEPNDDEHPEVIAACAKGDAAFDLMNIVAETPAATMAGIAAKAALSMAIVRFDARRMPVGESRLFWSICADLTRGVAP